MKLLQLLFAALFVLTPGLTGLTGRAERAALFTEIVAFGDSLSDNGNFAPYPPAYPGTSAYPKETWVKQLAGRFNIKTFEPSGTGPVATGTNYAFGGAMTKYSVDKKLGYGANFDKYNLSAQIGARYLDQTANPAGPRTGADVLHTIAIGGNDLVSASSQMTQITSGWATLDTVATGVAKSAEGQITVLAKAGVKNVLWIGLHDYSKVPFTKEIASKFGAYADTYLAALKRAAIAHNAEMDRAITRLKANPATAGVRVIKLDLSDRFADVQAHPAKYGFTNVTDKLTALPMLGLGGGDPEGKVDDYLFLDEMHPTFKGHAFIADEAYRLLTEN